MGMSRMAAIVTCAGLLLLVASLLASRLIPLNGGWSSESAVQLQKAAANYHDLLHARMHAGSSNQRVATELERVRAEYQDLQDQLAAAQSSIRTTITAIRWLGIIVSLTGVALFVRERNGDSRRE